MCPVRSSPMSAPTPVAAAGSVRIRTKCPDLRSWSIVSCPSGHEPYIPIWGLVTAWSQERPAAANRIPAVRLGLLTGGGDCPGLNAVIRGVVRKGIDGYGDSFVGFRDGWRGGLDDIGEELTIESTRGILPRGGTILGSSRTNPDKREDGLGAVQATLERRSLAGV